MVRRSPAKDVPPVEDVPAPVTEDVPPPVEDVPAPVETSAGFTVLDTPPPAATRRAPESEYAPGARHAVANRNTVVQYVIPKGTGDKVMRAMRRVAKNIDERCSTGHRVGAHTVDGAVSATHETILFWVKPTPPVATGDGATA